MDRSAHVCLELSSRAQNVALVRQALRGLADATGLFPADLNDIGTAVTEACNNVSAHAYEGREGSLVVGLLARGATIVVTVRDRGVGLALDGGAPRVFPSDVDGELAGIGVPSIQALAKGARWSEPSGGGTEVEMTFSTGSLDWKGVGSGYAFAEPYSTEPGSLAEAIEVGMAPVSVAERVLPRLLRAMADRAHFSVERHEDVQRVGSAALLADPSMWSASGVHARLVASGSSLEVAVGPLCEEDVARVAVSACATEPNLSVSSERLAGKPRRLVLRLDRSRAVPGSVRPVEQEWRSGLATGALPWRA
ncbi:MAG TPA: ATP-binding protein [Solirubrobacteraceae bacterium]|nr:ATP-binding protein [Solirubrobacteraceae bacterium]